MARMQSKQQSPKKYIIDAIPTKIEGNKLYIKGTAQYLFTERSQNNESKEWNLLLDDNHKDPPYPVERQVIITIEKNVEVLYQTTLAQSFINKKPLHFVLEEIEKNEDTTKGKGTDTKLFKFVSLSLPTQD